MKSGFLNFMFTVLGTFSLSQAAFARQSYSGIDEAYQFCSELSFQSAKDECMNTVRQSRYFSKPALDLCEDKNSFDSGKNSCLRQIANRRFDSDALRVCSKLSFDSSVAGCLGAIQDKRYSSAEVELCQAKSFDSDKTECLTIYGRPSYGDGDSAWIRTRLNDALRALDFNEKDRASAIIRSVLRELD